MMSTVLNTDTDGGIVAAASTAASATPITDGVSSAVQPPKSTKVVNLDDYITLDTIEAASTTSA